MGLHLKEKLIAKDPGMSVTTMGAVVTLTITLLGGGWWFAGVFDQKADAADVKAAEQRLDHIYDLRIAAKVREISALEIQISKEQDGQATQTQLEQLKHLRAELSELRELSRQ